MNKLSTSKRAQIVAAMVEGSSLRSISRMTGTSLVTILKLLADLGSVCALYHDALIRNVHAGRVQPTKSGITAMRKLKNVPEEMKGQGAGGCVYVGGD